ncbi:MAG: hypothetical protein M9894_15445 [Planctomycetes bacterium]|nr:hypothetical protein [Planctomycetota bacterium]
MAIKKKKTGGEPEPSAPPQAPPPPAGPPPGYPGGPYGGAPIPPPGYPAPPPGYPAPPPGYPGQAPGYGPPGYPSPQPAYAPAPGYGPGAPQPGYGMPYGNPMAQLMQMMAAFGGVGGPGLAPPGQVDPSAQPFMAGAAPADEQEPGLAADIVAPATVEDLLKEQKALPVQPVLDRLCLSPDGKTALGGLPQGCTIAFAGPPGRGKTRAMLEGVARVARSGVKCAYVVAEEGFRDEDNPGRDDLCSRFAKIAMAATGLDEDGLREHVLPNVLIIQSQYHKGHTWDDFIRRYRYVVEDQGVRFVVVDSLNTLDPTHARTAENLSVLKTYNHEHGVTCVTIGQIKDTGEPVGGEALMHTADAVLLIEELSLGSKEMAEFWGGKYREKITVLHARKSVTTPVFPHPVRVWLDEQGRLAVHPGHPAELALPPLPER